MRKKNCMGEIGLVRLLESEFRFKEERGRGLRNPSGSLYRLFLVPVKIMTDSRAWGEQRNGER